MGVSSGDWGDLQDQGGLASTSGFPGLLLTETSGLAAGYELKHDPKEKAPLGRELLHLRCATVAWCELDHKYALHLDKPQNLVKGWD